MARESGQRNKVGRVMGELGLLAYFQADYPEAQEGLAAVAAQQGQPGRAARLLGAAQNMREHIGALLPTVEQPDYQQALGLARDQLSEAAFAAAWAEGRAMGWEPAADYALEI